MIDGMVEAAGRAFVGAIILAFLAGAVGCELWHVATPYAPTLRLEWPTPGETR